MEFREIPNTDYMISNIGTVIGQKGAELVQMTSPTGYRVVNIYDREKNMKQKKVHRLVAEAFILNPENLPIVDHINRIRSDNRVENLRWVSSARNKQNSESKNNCIRFKNNKRFYAQFRCNGQYHGSPGFLTKEEAEEWLNQKRNELNHPLATGH